MDFKFTVLGAILMFNFVHAFAADPVHAKNTAHPEENSCEPPQKTDSRKWAIALSDGKIHEVTPFYQGKLSPFWAQEYVGSDLAREYLKKHGGLRTVRIGIVDSSSLHWVSKDLLTEDAVTRETKSEFEGGMTHGRLTMGVMTGEFPIGAAESAKFSLVDFTAGDDVANELKDFRKAKPEVLNVSMSADSRRPERKSPFNSEFLEPMAQETILVKSSGNLFPRALTPVHGAIAVGSLSPLGFQSAFSQEGEGLDILAPADIGMMSIGHGEESDVDSVDMLPSMASKTSAATPLVAGAIANVLSILPGLSTAEVKLLLKRTAVPLEGGTAPVGMLNAYQLVRVADRLLKSGFLRAPQEERTRRLLAPSLYDFSGEVHRLIGDARRVCDPSLQQKLLREAFLLEPSNTKAKEPLVKNYQQSLNPYAADFVESTSPEKLLDVIERGVKDRNPAIQASAVRALSRKGPEGRATFDSVLEHLPKISGGENEDFTQTYVGVAHLFHGEKVSTGAIGASGRETLVRLVKTRLNSWDLMNSLRQIPESEKTLIMRDILALSKSKYHYPREEALRNGTGVMLPTDVKVLEDLLLEDKSQPKSNIPALLGTLLEEADPELDLRPYRHILEAIQTDKEFGDVEKEDAAKLLVKWPQ